MLNFSFELQFLLTDFLKLLYDTKQLTKICYGIGSCQTEAIASLESRNLKIIDEGISSK